MGLHNGAMTDEILQTAGLIITALTLGVMLFFSLVVAPSVFIKLPAEAAGRFIRALFPWYYLVSGLLASIATILLAPINSIDAALAASVAFAALVSRQVLMPQINKWRDQMLAGDKTASSKFNRGHRASVLVNGAQLILLCLLVWRIGISSIMR